jgi:hypothetical protein
MEQQTTKSGEPNETNDNVGHVPQFLETSSVQYASRIAQCLQWLLLQPRFNFCYVQRFFLFLSHRYQFCGLQQVRGAISFAVSRA